MKPEYVDASDLIQPDTRSDAQKWLDAEIDKRWANEQGAEPFPILEAIALEVIEENQRMREQIGKGVPDGVLDALDNFEKKERSPFQAYLAAGLVNELRTALLASAQPAPQQKPLTDEHVTDGSKCWCDPELDYKDPHTGVEVWVHRSKQ